MAGCSLTPSTVTIGNDDACLTWGFISYSVKEDSPETVQQARENNAKRTTFCVSNK